MDTLLDYVAIIIGIIAPVIAWAILLVNSAKARANQDTTVKDELKSLKEGQTHIKDDLSEIKKTIGNGGYGGLKADIHRIEIEMSSLKEQVKAIQVDVTDLKNRN
jgi:hypothetical protein